jgi:uncharacterized membrane protein
MYQETLMAGARRQGKEAYTRVAVRTVVNNGKIFPPVTVLLMVTAIWLIIGDDQFEIGDAWIVAAIALWVIGVVLGILYFTPKGKEMEERLEEDGVTESLYEEVERVGRVARADVILLLGLLALMIFKPMF